MSFKNDWFRDKDNRQTFLKPGEIIEKFEFWNKTEKSNAFALKLTKMLHKYEKITESVIQAYWRPFFKEANNKFKQKYKNNSTSLDTLKSKHMLTTYPLAKG